MESRFLLRVTNMIPDGSYTAVVDEFEGSLARLELEAEDEELYELVVERDELPTDGRQTGAVIEVEVVDETLVTAEYKPDESRRRRQQAQSRFDNLSKRPPDDS